MIWNWNFCSILRGQRLKIRRASRTSATDCLQANCRVWNVIRTELFRTNKEVRIKEVTGLIYISVRPNLLRPFNACGSGQRSTLTIADRLLNATTFCVWKQLEELFNPCHGYIFHLFQTHA